MSFLSSLMNALPGAAAQGLAWGIMAIGVYITFRILDVADLYGDNVFEKCGINRDGAGEVGKPRYSNGKRHF